VAVGSSDAVVDKPRRGSTGSGARKVSAKARQHRWGDAVPASRSDGAKERAMGSRMDANGREWKVFF